MKPSGIVWLPFIPDSWSVRKGKYVFECAQKPVMPDDGVITCFRDGEVTLRSKRREDGFTIATKEYGYQGIDVGDLVVHGMDGFAGSIGISDSRGKASPVLNNLLTIQDKRYFMYFLRAMAYQGIFLALSTGIRVRTCDTNWGKLKELLFAFPCIEEQKRISAFLDRKTEDIDSLIAVEEAQIEQLNQYFESVSESVFQKFCKEMRKIKYVAEGISDGTHGTYERVQNGKYLLSAKNLGEQGIRIGDSESMISEQDYRSIIKKGYPTKNDILMCAVGDIGKVVLYEFDEPIAFQRSVMFIRPRTTMNPKFLLYALKLASVKNQEICAMNKTIQAGLYQGLVKEIRIPYAADMATQLKVVEELDKSFSEVQALIAFKQRKISLLSDYKKSLIYECVTGKKEVA